MQRLHTAASTLLGTCDRRFNTGSMAYRKTLAARKIIGSLDLVWQRCENRSSCPGSL